MGFGPGEKLPGFFIYLQNLSKKPIYLHYQVINAVFLFRTCLNLQKI